MKKQLLLFCITLLNTVDIKTSNDEKIGFLESPKTFSNYSPPSSPINFHPSEPILPGWMHEDGTWQENPYHVRLFYRKELEEAIILLQEICESKEVRSLEALTECGNQLSEVESLQCKCPNKPLKVECSRVEHFREKNKLDKLISTWKNENNKLRNFRLALSNMKIRLNYGKNSEVTHINITDDSTIGGCKYSKEKI